MGASSVSTGDMQRSYSSQTPALHSSPPTTAEFTPTDPATALNVLLRKQYEYGQEKESLKREHGQEIDRLKREHGQEIDRLKLELDGVREARDALRSALGSVWRWLWRFERTVYDGKLHATRNGTVIFRRVNRLDQDIINTLEDYHDEDVGMAEPPLPS